MYLAVERGSSLVVKRQQQVLAEVDAAMEKMVAAGYVVAKDGMVSLTPAGEVFCAEMAKAHPEMEARAKAVVATMREESAGGQMELFDAAKPAPKAHVLRKAQEGKNR